jgi:hypothetical protein
MRSRRYRNDLPVAAGLGAEAQGARDQWITYRRF